VDLNAPVSSQVFEAPTDSTSAGTTGNSPKPPASQTLILPDSLAQRPLMQFSQELFPISAPGSEAAYQETSPYLSLNPPNLLGPEPIATLYDLRILYQGFIQEFQQPLENPPSDSAPSGAEPITLSIPQNALIPGVFPVEIRRQDITGAFAPISSVQRTFITQEAVENKGIGLSLPTSSWILPQTRFSALPVFSAEEYQLFSPVDNENQVPPVQDNPLPEFTLPVFTGSDEYQVVFSALASGRPLLEIPLSLRIVDQPPSIIQVSTEDFTGLVFQHEMTAQTAAALLNNLYNQGFIRRRQSNSSVFEDSLGSHTVLGLSLLDYGRQFSIGFSSFFESTPGKERHPVVGVSQAGARLVAWAYTMLFDPTSYQMIYPDSWWNPLELEFTGSGEPLTGVFRLPIQREWSSLAQAPASYQLGENSSNYYRSFDPYEDPNPPFQRNGGPTTPVAFFSPDSVFGLYDTRGNVWEWARDIVTNDERPDLFRGPVSRHPVYRRVLGGAWNTPLEEYGPRGSQIPLGWFGEDFTSYSIGIRLFSSIPTNGSPIQNQGPK
jgi:hypothetical protein